VRRRQYARERKKQHKNTYNCPVISEDRLCFYPMAAGKKCGVQRKLLMGRVRLRVHTDTQQQAPSSFPCGVGELLLLCSRKESYPAHGDCTCRTDSENIPSQRPRQLLWLLTILYTRRACALKPNSNPPFRACEVEPNAFPLGHPKWQDVVLRNRTSRGVKAVCSAQFCAE
jgi:hypothetical protein